MKIKPFSVLIPDGESIFALKVLVCLGKIKGIKVYVLSNNPASTIRYSRYCTKFISYNGFEDSDRLTAIYTALATTKADVILPVDVKSIRLVSSNLNEIKKITAVPAMAPIASIDVADDKWLTYKWMIENNIASPSTLLFDNTEEFKEQIKKFAFPVLLKPRSGSGGEGIEKFEKIASMLDYCKKNEKQNDVIIQTFINGFDIDCSVMSKCGEILAYTIQQRFVYIQKPVAGELGVDFIFNQQTLDIVKEFIRKLNWSGIAHIDLRFDEKDNLVKIIEINPRYWASVSYSLFAGINFPYIACLQALKYKTADLQFSQKRIVQLRSALKIIVQRLFNSKRDDLHFDHIFLNQISFRDPLPYLVSKLPWLSKK